MPFVLKHKHTGQIAACVMKNIYDFDYYGVKWWEDAEEAERDKSELLSRIGETDVQEWKLYEVDENRVKIFNVRLKNDPSNTLFTGEDGTVRVTNQNS